LKIFPISGKWTTYRASATSALNGSVSSNQLAIREHIVQFYESLFSKQYNWWPRLDGLAFNSLATEEASRLELPIDEREVLEVVKGMNRDKVSSPNGFFPRLMGCDQVLITWGSF
jgi:hypothetical protein